MNADERRYGNQEGHEERGTIRLSLDPHSSFPIPQSAFQGLPACCWLCFAYRPGRSVGGACAPGSGGARRRKILRLYRDGLALAPRFGFVSQDSSPRPSDRPVPPLRKLPFEATMIVTIRHSVVSTSYERNGCVSSEICGRRPVFQPVVMNSRGTEIYSRRRFGI